MYIWLFKPRQGRGKQGLFAVLPRRTLRGRFSILLVFITVVVGDVVVVMSEKCINQGLKRICGYIQNKRDANMTHICTHINQRETRSIHLSIHPSHVIHSTSGDRRYFFAFSNLNNFFQQPICKLDDCVRNEMPISSDHHSIWKQKISDWLGKGDRQTPFAGRKVWPICETFLFASNVIVWRI